MTKKRFLSIAIVLILLLLVGGGLCLLLKKDKTVGSFMLTDYSDFIERFPSEKMVGRIDSVQTAMEKAEVVWKEIYGDEVKDVKPYKASFDDKNRVWLIEGTLRKKMVGGVPHILIQEDGRVLAIWHDK